MAALFFVPKLKNRTSKSTVFVVKIFMQLNKILQGDYTLSSLYHQIKLPFDIEISIPSDDPVRLLSAFVEGMDLSDLYATYDRIRNNQASPRQMLKIMIYAAMNRIYSSRDIESACRRDINFMFLLDGAPLVISIIAR